MKLGFQMKMSSGKMIVSKLNSFLSQQNNFIFVPNPGNAGDSIIAFGTLTLFKKLKITNFSIGSYSSTYSNQTLIFGGGGNLIGLYPQCYNFLQNNCIKNKIIVLSHTIKDVDNLFINPYIKKYVTFFCREQISYNYVKTFTNNVYLEHDLAFEIDHDFLCEFKEKKPTLEKAVCFRTDKEKLFNHNITDNNDISLTLNQKQNTSHPDTIKLVTRNIFSYLSNYSKIYTDRLHIAIAGSLLDKVVYLYPNSYYKNRAVFDFSLKDKFHNTYFISELINSNL